MGFIDTIKARAKADKKTIVLPESEDRRTYEAAAQILKEDLANLIIIGSEEAVKKGSEGLDVSKATIVDPEKNEKTQAYVDKLVELRAKKGMTPEKARETILNDYTYYGVMMVKMGDADGLVSGACHSTANTLRPCLQKMCIRDRSGHVYDLSVMSLFLQNLFHAFVFLGGKQYWYSQKNTLRFLLHCAFYSKFR